MFQSPNPLMTYNQQPRPQFQPQPSNRMMPQMPQQPQMGPQEQQNPLMAMMAQRGAAQMGQRMDQTAENNAAAQTAGANPLNLGQRLGATFGMNNYGARGGAADILRNQQGMISDTQGPPMPMDLFKGAGGRLPEQNAFFPSWLTSMFS